MEVRLRIRLSTIQTVSSFATGHPLADASFTAVVKRVNDALTAIDALGLRIEDGVTTEHTAVAQRRAARRTIRKQYLRRLAEVVRVAATGDPSLEERFRLPEYGVPDQVFFIAARALLAAVDASKDVLVPLGLGETFVADLTAALDAADAKVEPARNGRMNHVGARAQMSELARECMRDVRVLDTFYRAAFANDADQLAAWKSASNLAAPHQRPVAPPPINPEPPAATDAARQNEGG
ncbi:MAG: hypothetical protein ACREL5_04600 [Gemmatimonadales bacterium]